MKRLLRRYTVGQLASHVWNQIWEHELLTRASAIAFASMMAAVPLLVLAVGFLVRLLPDLSGSGMPGIGNLSADQVREALQGFFPELVYRVVAEELAHIQSHQALLTFTLPIALWTSSSAFTAIIDAINRIYGVKETRNPFKLRLLAMVMAVIQSIVLFACILVVLLWPHFTDWIDFDAGYTALITAGKWLALFLVLIGSYALTFRVGPDSPQSHLWVTPGAILGATIFLLASWTFRLYIQNFANYDAWYGSLGGVMAVMFWFWIISLVLLVAAELNRLIGDAGQAMRELPPDESFERDCADRRQQDQVPGDGEPEQ